MGTKNYEKDMNIQGLIIEDFLVEEFIGGRRVARILEIIFRILAGR
jgi:hypothetical protein